MEKEPRHWVEILSDRIVAEKEEPFIITSGITTSGSLHVGTLCEFLFSSAIEKYLKEKGYRTQFHFIADIFDAFDAVPLNLMKHEKQLTPHLGKPLCDVPDPVGCHSSYGEHFFSEAIDVMKVLEVSPKLGRANQLYSEGRFDSLAKFFLKNHEEAKRVVSESSLKQELPAEWNAIMPVCQNCGRIATTVVMDFDENSYSYKDMRDVKYTKGCGYEGENRLSDHKYKLTWRLHWPSWMEVFQTTVEGAGVDHHTRGGSWDTVLAVYKQLFKKEPPIGYKFGFILLKGKKYSKSKGIGLGVTDILELIPPELIKYTLFRPDIQENKDIDPTGYNLMRQFDDYMHASSLNLSSKELSRADRKKAIAFSLSTEKMRWKASFADILMYKQLYGKWEKVGELLHDSEGVQYLKPYVEKWIAEEFAPEEYSFSFQPTKQSDMRLLKEFASKLRDGMSALDIHNLVFEFAREKEIKPEDLFTQLYKVLLNKEKGPRMGKLIEAIEVNKVKETLEGM
jgi:lysyl-tRNA synthetase class 1